MLPYGFCSVQLFQVFAATLSGGNFVTDEGIRVTAVFGAVSGVDLGRFCHDAYRKYAGTGSICGRPFNLFFPTDVAGQTSSTYRAIGNYEHNYDHDPTRTAQYRVANHWYEKIPSLIASLVDWSMCVFLMGGIGFGYL